MEKRGENLLLFWLEVRQVEDRQPHGGQGKLQRKSGRPRVSGKAHLGSGQHTRETDKRQREVCARLREAGRPSKLHDC